MMPVDLLDLVLLVGISGTISTTSCFDVPVMIDSRSMYDDNHLTVNKQLLSLPVRPLLSFIHRHQNLAPIEHRYAFVQG